MNCPFCNTNQLKIIKETSLVFCIEDIHPVSKGHCLIIPKTHRRDFFALTQSEQKESFKLIKVLKAELTKQDPKITGFNIGMNCGASAGQTVFHCHIHFIPRRDGDVRVPRGGVRGVIPDKQAY